MKEEYYNKLYLKDTKDKTIIKLNDNDITNGVYQYEIVKKAGDGNFINLTLHMYVSVEELEVETEKVNLK